MELNCSIQVRGEGEEIFTLLSFSKSYGLTEFVDLRWAEELSQAHSCRLEDKNESFMTEN